MGKRVSFGEICGVVGPRNERAISGFLEIYVIIRIKNSFKS